MRLAVAGSCAMWLAGCGDAVTIQIQGSASCPVTATGYWIHVAQVASDTATCDDCFGGDSACDHSFFCRESDEPIAPDEALTGLALPDLVEPGRTVCVRVAAFDDPPWQPGQCPAWDIASRERLPVACGSVVTERAGPGDSLAMTFGCPDARDPAFQSCLGSATVDDLCAIDGVFVRALQLLLACDPYLELLRGPLEPATQVSESCYEQNVPRLDVGTLLLGSRDDLAACRAYLDDFDCSQYEPLAPSPCSALLSGTVGSGEACRTPTECAGDATCEVSDGQVCGTCQPRRPDDARCDDNRQCSNRRCSDGLCRDYADLGESCNADADCRGYAQCDAGGICRAVGGEGDACEIDSDCAPPDVLHCFEQRCTRFQTAGQPCGTGLPACAFFAYEACVAGTCEEALPPAGTGQACSYSARQPCTDSLVCSNPVEGGICIEPGDREGLSCAPLPDEEGIVLGCGHLLACEGPLGDQVCSAPAPDCP